MRCLPAGDKADAAVGSMLAQVLTLEGFRAEAAPLERLAAPNVDPVAKGDVDIVVLSLLRSSTLTSGRYLYKRLRRRLPDIPIVIGIWGWQGDLKNVESRLAPDGQAVLATPLSQAEKAVQLMARNLAQRKTRDDASRLTPSA